MEQLRQIAVVTEKEFSVPAELAWVELMDSSCGRVFVRVTLFDDASAKADPTISSWWSKRPFSGELAAGAAASNGEQVAR